MSQEGINVLSLFDGMSCGQQALERQGIKVNNYYASEIDKYAIQVTMVNYPNTVQLGSVVNVDASKLPKIDLLIGGSPCQSFSFAGKRKGMSTKCELEVLSLDQYLELKSQNFEFEGQSYLFWEYMRVLTDIRKTNPDVKFLLENVIMGAKWQKILSQAIGINPIEINSSLVSAQNRRRLYWTNIGAEQDGLFGDLKCMIPQPKDKGILLKHILEGEVDNKYYLSDKIINGFLNSKSVFAERFNPHDETTNKSYCITSRIAKMGKTDPYIIAMRGRNPDNPKSRESGNKTEQMIEPRIPNDGKTNCITTVQKDNLVYTANYLQYGDGYALDNRAYYEDGKQGTLDTKPNRAKALLNDSRIRRLTPLECERLQTVKDGYTAHVSDSQRYKMIGNGWTVDVISHIFSHLSR
jgi:DNA (cytosine-5)-methyltransferase 3A